MSLPTSHYRSLYRRLNRLPLDTGSLELLKSLVRSRFQHSKLGHAHSIPDRRSYDELIDLSDSILLKRKYRDLENLLDLIHKRKWQDEQWKRDFLQTKYSQWMPIWPQVHLLREFASTKHTERYNKELERQNPSLEFSFMKEMNLEVSEHLSPLQPLKSKTNESNLTELFQSVTKFHTFLLQNASSVMEVKLKPLEVIFEPSRKGLPQSVASMENTFKLRITYLKELCQKYRPLKSGSMDHLVGVATGSPIINPKFFRYMQNQSLKVSPFERKFMLQKQLIPNDRNIRFLYRDYAVRQFTVENGSYEKCPMQNFYESKFL